MRLDPALALTAALLLAGILATAAGGKLAAPGPFLGVVRNYRLLPEGLAEPFARLLPVIELVVALGLLLPATRAAAGAGAALLLLLFAAAMAANLLRGRADIDCGCFVGLMRQKIAWPLVVRNLVLAAAALLLAVSEPVARPLGALDWITVAAATGSLALLYAAQGRLFGVAPVALNGAR